MVLGSFFLNDGEANAYSSINKWRVAILEKGMLRVKALTGEGRVKMDTGEASLEAKHRSLSPDRKDTWGRCWQVVQEGQVQLFSDIETMVSLRITE